jgi:hypothetical protein
MLLLLAQDAQSKGARNKIDDSLSEYKDAIVRTAWLKTSAVARVDKQQQRPVGDGRSCKEESALEGGTGRKSVVYYTPRQ